MCVKDRSGCGEAPDRGRRSRASPAYKNKYVKAFFTLAVMTEPSLSYDAKESIDSSVGASCYESPSSNI